MTYQEAIQRRRLARRSMLGLTSGTIAATMFGRWGPTGAANTCTEKEAGAARIVHDNDKHYRAGSRTIRYCYRTARR
jgi:hypothetical protein